MAIEIVLPREVEAAAQEEAARRHMTVEQLAMWSLISQLPHDACPAAIRSLFQQFRAQREAALPKEAESDDFDFDRLVQSMNAEREGGRLPFPPELKGVTW